MNYFLGIDIGSQSSKGVLTDQGGKIIAAHTIPHKMDTPRPGYFEQDAEKIWWGEFCTISQELIKKSGVNPTDIRAVGHSATSPCVVFLDRNNKPLRPGILYGIDTRAFQEQEELSQKIGLENLMKTGGCSLSSQSVAPKILWVQKHEPKIWAETKKILTANGYIAFKLTGRYTQNTYDAVGFTGIFNIFTMQWIDEYLAYVCSKEYLPELVSPSQSIGGLGKEAAQETGLPEGIPVLPGIADAAAEALCAGVDELQEMMLMLGTSTFFILKTDKLYASPKFWPSNFLKDNEYVLTGGTSNCGSATTWFIDTFAADTADVYTVLLKEAEEEQTDEQSPITVPYFAGERTPHFDAKARAVFFGISFNHRRGALFRSLLEGIAYSIKDNIDELKKLSPIKTIYAIGGGTKNRLLLKFIADICQVNVILPGVEVGAAFGDAYLAACLINPSLKLKDWTHDANVISPDLSQEALYKTRYEKYGALYRSTRPFLG